MALTGSRLSGGSHCRCGGNSERTRITSIVCSCDWFAAISWWMGAELLLWMSRESGFLSWSLLLVKMPQTVLRPGAVAHACNPSTLGGWGGWITWDHEFKTSLGNMVKPHLYQKKKTHKTTNWPGMVAFTCGPSYLGELSGKITWTQGGCGYSEVWSCHYNLALTTEWDLTSEKK